ncbi:MAG: hypothetical protein ACKPKO_33025, partial [Candidatus Fonsibacter sp.]
QMEFIRVASYADEWFSHENLYLRSWYMCWCGACISSKVWTRRFMTPWQKKQKWYFCLCSREYKHAFGQLVESRVRGQIESAFSLASVPPNPIEDIRAKGLELKLKPETPADLYNALKQYKPTTGSILREARADEVWCCPEHMTVSDCASLVSVLTPEGRTAVEANPPFNWYQIFNWVDMVPTTGA